MDIKETDKILEKIRDYGFEIIDLEKRHKEQMDIFNIQIISEEYFNEKVNEALEIEETDEEDKRARLNELRERAVEKCFELDGQGVFAFLRDDEAREFEKLQEELGEK